MPVRQKYGFWGHDYKKVVEIGVLEQGSLFIIEHCNLITNTIIINILIHHLEI